MKHSPPESFLDTLMEHLASAIENPGFACAREEFIIYRPEEMTDDEWEAWKEELRAGFGEDPGAPIEEAPSPGA